MMEGAHLSLQLRSSARVPGCVLRHDCRPSAGASTEPPAAQDRDSAQPSPSPSVRSRGCPTVCGRDPTPRSGSDALASSLEVLRRRRPRRARHPYGTHRAHALETCLGGRLEVVALPARHVPHRATRFDTRDASRTRPSLSTRWTSSETSFSMVATVLRAPSRPAMLEMVPSRPSTCAVPRRVQRQSAA